MKPRSKPALLLMFTALTAFSSCRETPEPVPTKPSGPSQQDPVPGHECGTLPVLSSGSHCDVTLGTNKALLIRSNILAPSEVLQGGSVLLDEDGIIQCVGCNCAAENLAAGATVMVCPDAVVSPALINAHEHIGWAKLAQPATYTDERYEHRHHWRKGKASHTKIPQPGSSKADADILYGELRHFISGTVSMAGAGKADGLMRNLDENLSDTKEVGGNVYNQTFPLGDNDGNLLTSGCNYPWKDDVQDLKNECYLPHIAEGINAEAHNEFLCMSGQGSGSRDLVEPNTAIIHAVGMSAIDGEEILNNDSSVVWSPRSNVSLYGNTAPVTMYHNQGINIAMGTDWVLSGSANMVREMACADYMNKKHYGSFFKASDIWRMATENSARALKVEDKIGFLKNGYIGDIAIYALNGGASSQNVETYYQSIIDSTADEVVLVLRSGEMVFGDSDIFDAANINDCESMGDVCGSTKTICMTGAQSKYSEIKDDGAYKLFYCNNKWEAEPPCVPQRDNKDKNGKVIDFGAKVSTYDGTTSKDDSDGDGVPNSEDNCPTIFNPIRPLDKGVQADTDGDGVGDLCDPCPTEANTTECSKADPNDRDRDGVKDDVDNCLGKYNPVDASGKQPDADGDGKGDACDECPNAPNPGSALCPAMDSTIPAVQGGEVADEVRVNVSGYVSAIAANTNNSFFIQTAASFASKDAAKNQGLYVYIDKKETENVSAAGKLKVGQKVTVTATATTFHGEKELNLVEKITTTDPTETPMMPLALTIADLISETATPYEGILVTLSDVNVLTGGTSYFYIGESTAKLLVGNKIWTNSIPISTGATLTAITGVAMFAMTGDAKDSVSTIEPRGSADIAQDCSAGSTIVAMNPKAITLAAGEKAAITLSMSCPDAAQEIALTPEDACSDLITVGTASFAAGAASATAEVTAKEGKTGSCKVSYNNFETMVTVAEKVGGSVIGYKITLTKNEKGAADPSKLVEIDVHNFTEEAAADTYVVVARKIADYATWQSKVPNLPAQVSADKVIFVNLGGGTNVQFNADEDDLIRLYKNGTEVEAARHYIGKNYALRQSDGTFKTSTAPHGADGKAPSIVTGVNEPLYLYETGTGIDSGNGNYFIFYIP